MNYAIHKQTYGDGRAYRYHISDGGGCLRYIAQPTGLLLPTPTRLVEFFDPDHSRIGRLQPPDPTPWRRGTCYRVFTGEGTKEPYAVIRERWRLVDILLLRLPRYEVQLGEYRYVARGSRYRERFYEIFQLWGHEEGVDRDKADKEEASGAAERNGALEAEGKGQPRSREAKVGQIEHPPAGPSYIVQIDAAPLRQALLVLAALVTLIDLELYA